jgi:Uma2 family endonuclease
MAVAPAREWQEPFRPLTQAEFKQLPEGPPYYEFEHGKVIEMPRPHPRHNRIVLLLGSFLTRYVEENGLGLVFSDVEVDLTPDLTYAPDLFFLATERLGQYDEDSGDITGPPSLAIEVVSPKSASRDRLRKFEHYRAAGVEWYWLIDPQEVSVEEYHLREGDYIRKASVAAGEVFRPGVFPGLEIDLAALVAPPSEAAEEEAE